MLRHTVFLPCWPTSSDLLPFPRTTGRQLSATRRDLLENHANAGQRDSNISAGPDDYDAASPLMLTEANQRQPGMMAPLPPTSPRASPIVSPQAFLSQTRSHQLMKVRPVHCPRLFPAARRWTEHTTPVRICGPGRWLPCLPRRRLVGGQVVCSAEPRRPWSMMNAFLPSAHASR